MENITTVKELRDYLTKFLCKNGDMQLRMEDPSWHGSDRLHIGGIDSDLCHVTKFDESWMNDTTNEILSKNNLTNGETFLYIGTY